MISSADGPEHGIVSVDGPEIVDVDGVPQLPAYHGTDGLLHVWCRYCCCWHRHGPGAGHRAAACDDRDSPYVESGYWLVPAGAWAGCFGGVQESALVLTESELMDGCSESEGG
jgi:hypothetical protein